MASMIWDLSPVVASTDPERIKDQLASMVRDAAGFAERYRGRVEGLDPGQLKELLSEKDELLLRYEGAFMYCHLSFAADQTDPLANMLNEAATRAGTEAGQHLAFLDIELGRSLAADPALVEEPALADYRHYLEGKMRNAPYLLSEAEEKLIMAKDQSGTSAWSKFQNKWLSTRQFRAVIDGTERNLSIGEVVPYMYDPDRSRRRAVYEALGRTLGTDELLYADTLRAIWTDHLEMCKLRHYPSALTSSLIANDVEEEAIDALMRVVEGNAGLCQRYFRLKAGLLGLPKLGHWDLRAPLPDAPNEKLSWDQARELLVSVYSGFDHQYGRWVEEMYAHHRLDGEVRKGKRAGAFCDTWLAGRSAFILSSYNGLLNDTYTLAHELGHGVHAYLYTRSQNPSNCQVSLCVAECGSLFGELLLTERLLGAAATTEQERAILVKILNSFAQTVYQEGFRYFFERSVADAMQSGEYLDGAAVSDLWMSAQLRLYGDTVEFLPESKWDWARFPHHFFAETRFYEYPYVFAQLFVFALYRMYKEQGKAFVPKLNALLSAGSSRSASQLAAELGFDIGQEEFWQKGMDQAEEFLEQLEAIR